MELAIILLIAVVFFGTSKLAGLGGSLGKGIKEFREATKEIDEASKDVKEVVDEVSEETK
ncbi:MAG: twin-arginine translocase TatA/TatE family subunit [Anaerolineae bacterium]|nr:twin-arginine translocase TatA/TatE family subunit [Anaerolineae bacterium]